jgi:hypothetical protein
MGRSEQAGRGCIANTEIRPQGAVYHGYLSMKGRSHYYSSMVFNMGMLMDRSTELGENMSA